MHISNANKEHVDEHDSNREIPQYGSNEDSVEKEEIDTLSGGGGGGVKIWLKCSRRKI